MRRPLPRALALALALSLSSPSNAGPPAPPTNVLYGFLTTSRTLTVAPPGPFYYLPGDLIVRPGVTLAIEPGVQIACSSVDTLVGSADPSRVELIIQGRLECSVFPPQSIVIQSSNGIAGSWAGVRTEGVGILDLDGATIRDAETALNCWSGGPHSFHFLTVANCLSGISAGYSECQITDCRITGKGSAFGWAGTGLQLGASSIVAFPDSNDARPTTVSGFATGVQVYNQAVLQNLIVRDNATGIYSTGPSVINYCTIVRNQSGGVYLGDGLLLNSVITNNGSYGVYNTSSSSYVDYCDSWFNGPNFYTYGPNVGPNIASFNPFYLDYAANDFRLGAGSVFKNWSNSGGEIGAYGPGPGLPVNTRKTTWGRLKALYR